MNYSSYHKGTLYDKEKEYWKPNVVGKNDEKSFIDFCKNYLHPQNLLVTEKGGAGCFCGELKEDNTLHSSKNIINWDFIPIDFDNVLKKSVKDFAQRLKDKNLNFIIFPSASFLENSEIGRYKGIIPLKEKISPEDLKQSVYQLVKLLGYNFSLESDLKKIFGTDLSFMDNAHVQFFPTLRNEKQREVYKNNWMGNTKGEYFSFNPSLETIVFEKENIDYSDACTRNKSYTPTLSHTNYKEYKKYLSFPLKIAVENFNLQYNTIEKMVELIKEELSDKWKYCGNGRFLINLPGDSTPNAQIYLNKGFSYPIFNSFHSKRDKYFNNKQTPFEVILNYKYDNDLLKTIEWLLENK